MKLSMWKAGRKGIAMTEYLIILAVVAIAAIVIVGLFGQQIKNVFSKSGNAMGGTTSGVTDTGATMDTAAKETNSMANFNKE